MFDKIGPSDSPGVAKKNMSSLPKLCFSPCNLYIGISDTHFMPLTEASSDGSLTLWGYLMSPGSVCVWGIEEPEPSNHDL